MQDATKILFRFTVAVLHRSVEVVHTGTNGTREMPNGCHIGKLRGANLQLRCLCPLPSPDDVARLTADQGKGAGIAIGVVSRDRPWDFLHFS